MKAAFFFYFLSFYLMDGYIYLMQQPSPSHIYSLLKKMPGVPQDSTNLENETCLDDAEGKKIIICRECGFKISDTASKIRINSNHEHSFFNPHGYVFQICCFSTATGCITAGEPSSEFSWFAGHTWQIAACGKCLTHLGWKFQSGSNSFFGLIKNNIREKE